MGRTRCALFASLLLVPAARGEPLLCGRTDPDVIHVDGLLEDWEGEAGIEVGGSDPDLSFTLRCNYDAETLYLAVDARDDVILRTPRSAAGEDHVAIDFAGVQLEVFPELGAAPRRVRWTPGRAPAGLVVSEARQLAGWSIELRLPLARVPGLLRGAPGFALAVAVVDGDRRPGEARLSSSPRATGSVEFAAARAHLAALLEACHRPAAEVVFDRVARLARGDGHRVVIAGRCVGAIADEFVYAEAPIDELLEARLIDFAGDGRHEIVLRYRERLPSGSREVLAIYALAGEGLRRRFACELDRAAPGGRVSARARYPARGRGVDLLLEAQPVIGWNEVTYRPLVEEGLEPTPVPWRNGGKARYRLRGERFEPAK